MEAPSPWGADVNRGAGPKLIDEVDGELASLIRLPAAAREKKAAELARKRAHLAIEGWKRFRNPELATLAQACLSHADWRVVHRALHWLSAIDPRAALAPALARLDHKAPLLRERAILAALDGWDDAAGAAALGGPALPRLFVRRDREEDPCIRSALTALIERIDSGRAPRRLAGEPRQTRKDGLVWTPFLSGASQIPTISLDRPHLPTDDVATESPLLASAQALGWPLLQWGHEEVPRIELQPFGKLRRDGALVHTGVDVGACRDGSGFYAIADGVVRLVDSGGTAGTRFVVEHRRGDVRSGATTVNAVYMHASGRVFVEAGDRVACHQLLGTMGDSFSFENGGHFAHLHLGLYPGPFDRNHNHGYQPASGDLSEWLDPAAELPDWIAAAASDGADDGR
jgi:murein DD-endopeptidase MepM/ murein hydrolase activator NlpD